MIGHPKDSARDQARRLLDAVRGGHARRVATSTVTRALMQTREITPPNMAELETAAKAQP